MRLWDTYLAEGVRMKEYLTYVLAAFLLTWSSDLKHMDFQVRRFVLYGPTACDSGDSTIITASYC